MLSRTVPETSRNTDTENQEATSDRSQNDLHPAVDYAVYWSRNSIDADPDESSLMVTGCQEEIPYCCLVISSGKQKKARPASQPQIRSEITSATIEANQISLVPQQLASYDISANFNNNSNRISKLPESSLQHCQPSTEIKNK